MSVFDAIYNRRAIKQFDPTYQLSDEEEKKLFAAMLQSPTSFNIQHWRFIILRDPQLRAEIRQELGNDQAQMTDASLLVLFSADVKAWQKEPARYCRSAPENVAAVLLGMIDSFYSGRDRLQLDEAQRSIGIAMQTLMLAAYELGYQSCPMIGFDIDGLARKINLPDDYVLGPMVAIGKAIHKPWPKGGQLTIDELVVENVFK